MSYSNELFSFPYKREEGTGKEGRKKSICFYRGEDVPFGREKKGTLHLLGMVTTDPDNRLKGALHGRIMKAVTYP
jgi:hypothetical protein